MHGKAEGVEGWRIWQSLSGAGEEPFGGPQRREGIGDIVRGHPARADLRYDARERLRTEVPRDESSALLMAADVSLRMEQRGAALPGGEGDLRMDLEEALPEVGRAYALVDGSNLRENPERLPRYAMAVVLVRDLARLLPGRCVERRSGS